MKTLDCSLYKGIFECDETCAKDKGHLCCFYCGKKYDCIDACNDWYGASEIEDERALIATIRYTNGRESAETYFYEVNKEEVEGSIHINIARQVQGLDVRGKDIGFWEINAKMLVEEEHVDSLKENVLQYFRLLYNTVVELEKWGHSNESISLKLKEELNDLTKNTSVGTKGGNMIAGINTGINKFCDDCEKRTDFDVVNEGFSVEQDRNLFSSTCEVCGKKEFEWKKL